MSIASCRQSAIVSRTSMCSGISMGPAGALSWQAASEGNTAAMRSSASIRWMLNGFSRPPLRRSTASARLRFQRQRAVNIGLRSTAWETASCTLSERRNAGTSSSGNECCGPSDSSTASLLAAAWSSKSNVRQNFLRSASPSARLTRAPSGAWTISCMPPLVSKKRSNTMSSCVGSTPPNAARPARR